MFAQLQFAIDDAKLTFLTTKKEQIEKINNSSLICSSVFLKKTDPREKSPKS